MKKEISISALQVGMFVNAITKSETNLTVKSQGMIKSQATLDSLVARGILAVEIDINKSSQDIQQTYVNTIDHDNESDDLVSASSEISKRVHEVVAKKAVSFEQQQKDLAIADRLYTEAREVHVKFIKQLKSGQAPDFDALNNLSQEIIDNVFDNPDALACLIMLKESNDYLVEHSLNCSILLSIFAKHLDLPHAEIEDLTVAGLLMDCGMALLPKELNQRTDSFDDTDIALMRTHVDIGIEIAERFSDVPPIVLDIIANHHERIDGSGYPRKLEQANIHQYVQMAAIVDCYDAMLTDRPFKSSQAAQQALEDLQKDSRHDVNLVNEFIKAVGLFPVGCLVQLKSGKLGIVVQRNRKDPLKPTVMTFYSTRGKHHTEVKRVDLQKQSNERIVSSVTPEEFDINLPHFFRNALLPF
ncbi:MAG: HD domain-containing phosphohydrolase [Glaciecola sp.]